MKMELSTDTMFSLAADIVANTSQSVFLTGKAGTGKTTFLRYIRSHVDKNVVVAAPTGVAAINAGGVTLHSFLQLPFEPFVPDFEGRKKLEYHLKLRRSKIEMIRELELLIIDEVSMLRADMLDAIDFLLKRYRNNNMPFGGVQMLFIGDLFQLPPVVQPHEWNLLNPYYASPFFFHAQALQDNLPLYVELKTIYRQSDNQFIDILNRIRNNVSSAQDLQILNARFNPNFSPKAGERFVTLCTHNYKADQINRTELEKLTTDGYRFVGDVRGNFAENSFPTDIQLTLKIGAQVMFVKNDSGEHRRYYNGKLATIIALSDKSISVQFEDESILELEKETWRNVRYVLNEESGEIEEDELGSFSQYPVRLAWAITIHKSQGLTFDRVVIDAGQAFAAGQVYVALSRCTSLEGIVLYSPITADSIQTDREAILFAKFSQDADTLKNILEAEKPNYTALRLKRQFDWGPMRRSTQSLCELLQEKKIPKQEEMLGLATVMCERAFKQEEYAYTFSRQIDAILSERPQNLNLLKQRVQQASLYFYKDIQEHIVEPFASHLDELKNASRVKQYMTKARELYSVIEKFQFKLQNIYYGNIKLTEGVAYPESKQIVEVVEEKQKSEKGDSKKLTLTLFKEGKTVADIANERNLKPITVEGHLSDFVLLGEVKPEELISKEVLDYLTPLLQQYTLQSPLKSIKERLPERYTYFEIKVVLNYLETFKL